MLIINYGFLGLRAAVSCAVSLWWLGMQKKQCVIWSAVAGTICSLSFCLNAGVQVSGLLCMVFLILYLPIIIQPKGNVLDAVAAASIACACSGMLQVTVDVILSIDVISLFSRVMLIIVCFLSVFVICGRMSEEFPETGWQENFDAGGAAKKALKDLQTEFYIFFPLYASGLVMPVILDKGSISVFLVEWVSFFGGLRLVDLMIANRREKMTVMTEIQYRDDMQTYMSVIRSQRHDYNFHVQTLHGLLLRKDYDACGKYLNELLKDSIAMNQLLPLQDAAISALILSFKNKAAQSGIRMDISIENDLSQIVTNVYETNKVIGNLLQNAIDETETVPDKSYGIRLSILKRGEFCIINVSNRVGRTDPMEAYQVGHSSKKGHEGIGIASIQALASKYGGVVYSRMEGDIIYFVAKLPLRLYKEES